MAEPVKVVVVLEGGLVQGVYSLGVPIATVVVDYDTKYASEDGCEVYAIPQDAGASSAKCLAYITRDHGQQLDPAIKDWANKVIDEGLPDPIQGDD